MAAYIHAYLYIHTTNVGSNSNVCCEQSNTRTAIAFYY